MKLLLALALAALATACGPHTTMMTAREPAPASLIVRPTGGKTFTFVAGIGEDPACVETGPIGERYCFAGFWPAFQRATEKALATLLTPSAAPVDADFRAEVKNLTLGLSSDHGYTIFTIAWEFELVDRTGRPIVHLQQELTGTDHIDYAAYSLPTVIARMQASILDRIVAAVAASTAMP